MMRTRIKAGKNLPRGRQDDDNNNNTTIITTTYDCDEEYQKLIDSEIGEERLKRESGCDDLSIVTTISIVVDTTDVSLLGLTELLPSLSSLVLDGSNIVSIRDLGSSLRCLEYLSLNDCQLNDLDGIGVLVGLIELSLCDNSITDVAPLAMHENLTTLNISGNKLSGLTIADALSSCPSLRSLFLSRNPIEKAPRYRLLIASLIPCISMLDGLPVDHDAQAKISNGMILEAAYAMSLQNEENDDEKRLEMMMFDNDTNNDTTNNNTTTTNNSSSADSSMSHSRSTSTMLDTGSELTHGSNVALAGNMAAAIRKRRCKYTSSDDVSTLDILDNALLSSSSLSSLSIDRTQQKDKRKVPPKEDKSDLATIPFFSEGDLTKQLNRNTTSNSMIIDTDDTTTTTTKSSLSPNMRSRSSNDVHHLYNTSDIIKFNGRDKMERPKSAAPSYLRSSTAPTQLEDGRVRDTVVNSLEFYPESPPPSSSSSSPRQMNSSRPQSAVPGSRSHHHHHHQVPFRIAVDGSDITKLKTKLNIASKRSTSSSDASPPRESYITNMKAHDDDHHQKIKSNSSIIHRDIIIRNEDDLEDEDIGVTHASRHRLMASSSSSSSRYRTTRGLVGGLDSPEITPRSASVDISNISSVECTPVIESTPKTPMSLVVDKTPKTPASSSSAAVTLSYDLHRPNSATMSSMAGVSLGFDLLGSLAAIDQWVEDMESDSDNDDEDIQQVRMKMKSLPIKEKRILSRDTILSMCTDNDNNNNDDNINIIINNNDNVTNTNDIDDDNNIKIFSKKGATKSINKTGRSKPKPLPDITTDTTSKATGIFTVEDTSPPRQDNSNDNNTTTDIYDSNIELGDWNLKTDIEIIEMLKQPPKLVPCLKTRSSFQSFFKGIKETKMRMLLEEAFISSDINERKDKINRRMDLLGDVLMN